METILAIIAISGSVGVNILLLRHIDRLENKLMARDYTEYSAQSRGKIGPAPNFMKDAIKKSYKGVSDDGE